MAKNEMIDNAVSNGASSKEQQPLDQIKVLVEEESTLLDARVRLSNESSFEHSAKSGQAPCLSDQDKFDETNFKYEKDFHYRERSALCLSGGGIRSATFSLGVLQGLAKTDSLKHFDFLSTVSGGGFIGSWLTRWYHEQSVSRSELNEVGKGQIQYCDDNDDNAKVEENVSDQPEDTSNPQKDVNTILASDATRKSAIERLREYSNYLSPKRGLSRDGLTLAAIYLRNLFLNWLVIVPLLLGVLLIPRLAMDWFSGVGGQHLVTLPIWSIGFLVIGLSSLYVLRHFSYFVHFRFFRDAVIVLSFVVAIAIAMTWKPLTKYSTMPGGDGYLAAFSVLAVPIILLGIALLYGLVQGLLSAKLTESVRERSSRDVAALIKGAGVWLILSSVVLIGPLVILHLFQRIPYWISALSGAIAFIAIVVGYFGDSNNSSPSEASSSLKDRVSRYLLPISAGIFLMLLGIGLSLGTSVMANSLLGDAKLGSRVINDKPVLEEESGFLKEWFDDVDEFVENSSSNPESNDLAIAEASQRAKIRQSSQLIGELPAPKTKLINRLDALKNQHLAAIAYPLSNDKGKWLSIVFSTLGIVLVLFIISILFSRLFGANRFSLHAMYQNRLVRAYLAAARKTRCQVDSYTGFDETDDMAISQLKVDRPLHLVNAAMNLSSGSDNARQCRKGISFTFSKLHSGSALTGFQYSGEYAGGSFSKHGITAGKAMSVSGAAVSPSMGYHSSKLVGAVLAFFNARLGWWLPNPSYAGMNVWGRDEPKVGIFPLLDELTSRTSEHSDFVYVSDGGHFENLGLYEMVRRRCRRIVVVDAGQDVDNEYESLSTAIRLIRVDFGIDITFDEENGPFAGNEMQTHYAIGNIHYASADGPDAEDGVIIYIKPVMTGDEPIDLVHYAAKRLKAGAVFPQETTADQFFDEAQFESYRKLGLMSVQSLAADVPSPLTISLSKLRAIGRMTVLPKSKEILPETPPATVGQNENKSDLLGAAPAVADWLAPTSSWIAPAVASTIAASAVVALTVTVVAPDNIALKAPDEPIRLAMPTNCVEGEGNQLLCGTLDVVAKVDGVPDLLIHKDDRALLKKLTAPDEQVPADSTPVGFVLSEDARKLLTLATGQVLDENQGSRAEHEASEKNTGLQMNSSHFSVLEKATDNTKEGGVKFNAGEIEKLKEVIVQLQDAAVSKKLDNISAAIKLAGEEITKIKMGLEAPSAEGTPDESVYNQLENTNEALNDIKQQLTDGFDGLRNDSGVVR